MIKISDYKAKIREHKLELLVFLAIFALGIFLRTYHFSSWLHFEVDQAYDFNIVSSAVENGPENLPLLGPTAGGGRALRLGPIFYYLEYASALIFGNTPTGHAMLVLIFSILTIPLFYFFCRRYFAKSIALAILAIFAASFYNVLYSRFSWSPNVLPFLILLAFFALLKSVQVDEPKRERWFLLVALAGAMITQIHFNAFFTIPVVIVTFLLIKRPSFSIKTWLIAFSMVLVVYSPMIASDISAKGENLQLFEKKIFKANSGAIKFKASFLGDLQHNTLAYFFIVTGQGEINNKKIKGFTLLDMQQPTKTFLINLSALIFFILSMILLVKRLWLEKISEKKDFLMLTALWFSFSFLYFFSIVNSYRMYPRFFLLVSPIAIIFLGFIFEEKYSFKFWKNSKFNIFALILLTTILATSNIFEISKSFDQLRTAGTNKTSTKLETEDVFPNTERITLSQQEDIAAYIASIAEKNGFPVYLATVSEYKPSLWYHLEKLGVQYHSEIHDSRLFQEANYFFVISSDKPARAGQDFVLNKKKEFGSLTVYYFSANKESVFNKRQLEDEKEMREETKNILQIPTWNKL